MFAGIDVTGLFWRYRTGVQNYYYGLMEGLTPDVLARNNSDVALLDFATQDVHHLDKPNGSAVEFRRGAPLAYLPTFDEWMWTRVLGRGVRTWRNAVRALRLFIAEKSRIEARITSDLDVLQVWNWDIRTLPQAKHVITIPDVIPLLRPELYDQAFLDATKTSLEFARDKADRVIAISNYTKQDLIEVAGIPESKIDVVYYGVHKHFCPVNDASKIEGVLQKYNISAEIPFVLSVGFLDPRKNIKGHIKAFEKLVCDSATNDIRLVLVGPEALRTDEILQDVKSSSIRDMIQSVGYVPHEEIPILMSAARAFLYCSFYEGFGLPVLEAMACGLPVVTSNRTSLPEVAGNACIITDPEDTDAIAQGLQDVLTDDRRHKELSELGIARAKKFTWDKAAEAHLGVFKACMEI